jgi:hypothetical protein
VGDYPPYPWVVKTTNSPVLQPGDSWTYTYDDGPGHNVGVCEGSDRCRARSIMLKILPLGQTDGNIYYDSVISNTPGSASFVPW